MRFIFWKSHLGEMKSRPLAPSPVKQRWMLLMNFLNKKPFKFDLFLQSQLNIINFKHPPLCYTMIYIANIYIGFTYIGFTFDLTSSCLQLYDGNTFIVFTSAIEIIRVSTFSLQRS